MKNRPSARRATITDIATRAGVSKSTVSHALSGKRPISRATQQRVRAAIAELGYRPNAVAQRLAGGGHSRNIGLVYPLSQSYADTEAKFIVNAANEARAANYAFLLLSYLEGATAPFERVVESGLVDGFILMQVHLHDPRVDLLRHEQIPFVLLGRCADNTGLSFVDVDIEAGVASALAHLAELGHRTIAYLPLDNEAGFGFAERLRQSFCSHCQQWGLTGLLSCWQPAADGGATLLDELLGRSTPPTALLVRSPGIAESILRGVRQRGLTAPRDLSLIAMGSPAERAPLGGDLQLTLIDIQAEVLASNATRYLLAQLEEQPAEVTQLLIPPTVLIGKSSGPAPG